MADFREKTDEFFYDNYTRAWVGTTPDKMLPVYSQEMGMLIWHMGNSREYHQELASDYPLALKLTVNENGVLRSVKKPPSPYHIFLQKKYVLFYKKEEQVFMCSHNKFISILSYYIGELKERFGIDTENWEKAILILKDSLSEERSDNFKEKLKDTLKFWIPTPGNKEASFEGYQKLHLSAKDIVSFRQLNCEDTLTSLQADCMPKTKDIEVLSSYTRLKCLYLRSMDLKSIEFLSPLINIDELGLPGNRITDLSPLKNLKKLSHLFIVDNPITDFSVLEELPNLKKLYVDDKQMPDESFWNKVPDKVSLSVLHVTGRLDNGTYHSECVYSREMNSRKKADPQTKIPEVRVDPRRLSIRDRWLYSGMTNALGYEPSVKYDVEKLKNLDCSDKIRLCMDYSFLDEIGDYSCLQYARSLRSLNLSGRVVNDFSFLKGLANLQILNLSNTSFSDLSLLENCTMLSSLTLVNCKLKKEDEHILKKLPKLKSVNLACTALARYSPSDTGSAVHSENTAAKNSPSYTGSMERAEKIVAKIKELSAQNAFSLEIDHDIAASLTSSKLGGLPYWEKNREYPKDETGENMLMLAQINLSDLTGEHPFPKSGLLQFFISNDSAFGLERDVSVILHRTIDPSVTEKLVKKMDLPTTESLDDDSYFPFEGTLPLSIKPCVTYINTEDYRFGDFFERAIEELFDESLDGEEWFDYLNEQEEDYIYDELSGGDHQMLGYGFFTQSDPREYPKGDEKDYDTMLLQIDSDDDIMWGDGGVANFFISHQDLADCKFDDVLYSWDCF